jgi:hypothetical protein
MAERFSSTGHFFVKDKSDNYYAATRRARARLTLAPAPIISVARGLANITRAALPASTRLPRPSHSRTQAQPMTRSASVRGAPYIGKPTGIFSQLYKTTDPR